MKPRFRRREPSRQVNRENVAARVAVEAYSLSDGGGELAKGPFCRWGYFAPIESSGQDERAHDLELSSPAPGHAPQKITEPDAFGNPAVERHPTERGTNIKLSPKVPRRDKTRHPGLNVSPIMLLQLSIV